MPTRVQELSLLRLRLFLPLAHSVCTLIALRARRARPSSTATKDRRATVGAGRKRSNSKASSSTGSTSPSQPGLLPDGRTRHPSASFGSRDLSESIAAFRATMGLSISPSPSERNFEPEEAASDAGKSTDSSCARKRKGSGGAECQSLHRGRLALWRLRFRARGRLPALPTTIKKLSRQQRHITSSLNTCKSFRTGTVPAASVLVVVVWRLAVDSRSPSRARTFDVSPMILLP